MNPDKGDQLKRRALPLGIAVFSSGLTPATTIGFAREETIAGLKALWKAEAVNWLKPLPVLIGPPHSPPIYKLLVEKLLLDKKKAKAK